MRVRGLVAAVCVGVVGGIACSFQSPAMRSGEGQGPRSDELWSDPEEPVVVATKDDAPRQEAPPSPTEPVTVAPQPTSPKPADAPAPAPPPAKEVAREAPLQFEVAEKSKVAARGDQQVYGRGAAVAPAMPTASLGKRAAMPDPTASSEGYTNYGVNPLTDTKADRFSTFAVDVDTASYSIARRKIVEGVLPPKDSVRVEEFLNYFRWDYPSPESAPFAVHMDAAPSPYTKGRHLLRVGVQGRRVKLSERKAAHLTFLVDVSGSMHSPDKLPLAKKALRILVDNLRDGDSVSLVTYAGGVREVLPPTGLEQKVRIHDAIDNLTAGGSTAMASGIELAFRNAAKTLSKDSVSRVVILSDGDANVGATGHAEILKLIERQVKEGVTVSVVGFGMGNYKDDLMEQFADKGNGNYAYVDSQFEAKRVFQEQLGATLEVIAQDAKIQVEFDPVRVKSYRLVGYENRDIADRDFRNDKVDAGEIGSGHSVTALYEVELVDGTAGGSLATVRMRAKKPRGSVADEWAFPFDAKKLAPTFEAAPRDLRFAAAVIGAAEIFRQSSHAAAWDLADVERIAREAAAPGNAERQEFVELVGKARKVVTNVAVR